jgi:hypothetical protein
MPIRKSDSEAIILLAVAVASPGSISWEGTYNKPMGPVIAMSRYQNPAILAVFLREFIFCLLL